MATTKAKSKRSTSSSSSAAKKPRSKNSGAPGWVGPAAVGGGLLIVGLGVLLSRKASASDGGSTPSNNNAIPADNTKPTDNTKPADDTPPTDNSKPSDYPPPNDNDIDFPVFSGEAGAAKLKELCGLSGLDKEWTRFFMATARGESAFTSNVVLGDPALYPVGSKPSPYTDTLGKTEANGARIAYERGLEQGRYIDCPWPSGAFTYGSGGWFGMVVANAWYAYDETSLKCRHPWYLLHPVDQVITATEIARRLKGWKTFKANPTWLNMRVGWGNPSGMDNPESHERMALKFGPHLKALGIPNDWMHQKVTGLPSGDVVARWEALMAAAKMDPGKRGV